MSDQISEQPTEQPTQNLTPFTTPSVVDSIQNNLNTSPMVQAPDYAAVFLPRDFSPATARVQQWTTENDLALRDAFAPPPALAPGATDAEKMQYGLQKLRSTQAQTMVAYLNYQMEKDPTIKTDLAELMANNINVYNLTPEQRMDLVRTYARNNYIKAIEQFGYLPREVINEPLFAQFATPEVYTWAKTMKDIDDEQKGISTGPIDTLVRAYQYADASRDADLDFHEGTINQAQYEERMAQAYWDYASTGAGFSDEVAQVAAGFVLPFTDLETWEIIAASAAASAVWGAIYGSVVPVGGTATGAVAGFLTGLGRGIALGFAGSQAWDTYRQSHGRLMYRAVSESRGRISQTDAYNLTQMDAAWMGALDLASVALGAGTFTHAAGKFLRFKNNVQQLAAAAKAGGSKALLKQNTRKNFMALMGETGGSYAGEVLTEGLQGAIEEHAVNRVTGQTNSEFDAFMQNAGQAARIMAVFSGVHALPRLAKTYYEYKAIANDIKAREAMAEKGAVTDETQADPAVLGTALNRLIPDEKYYFNVTEVKEAIAREGLDVDSMPPVFQNLDEQLANGVSEIEISEADWQNIYKNDPQVQKIMGLIRAKRNGATAQEIKEQLASWHEWEKQVEGELKDINETETELREVNKRLTQRMMDSRGFKDAKSTNQIRSTIMDYFRAISIATGIKPLQLFELLAPKFGRRSFVLGGNNPKALGGFDTNTFTFLYDDAASSVTLLHETGHFFLEGLYKLEDALRDKPEHAEAAANLRKMLSGFEKWAGLGEDGYRKLSEADRRKLHENFVNNYLISTVRNVPDRNTAKIVSQLRTAIITALSKERKAQFKEAERLYRAEHPEIKGRGSKDMIRAGAAERVLNEEFAEQNDSAPIPLNNELQQFIDALTVSEAKVAQIEAEFDLISEVRALAKLPDQTPEELQKLQEIIDEVNLAHEKALSEQEKLEIFSTLTVHKYGKKLEDEYTKLKSSSDKADQARRRFLQELMPQLRTGKFRELMRKAKDSCERDLTNKQYWRLKGRKDIDGNVIEPGIFLDRKLVQRECSEQDFILLDRMGLLKDKGEINEDLEIKTCMAGWNRAPHSGMTAFQSMCHDLACRETFRKQVYRKAARRLFMTDATTKKLILTYLDEVRDRPLGLRTRAELLKKSVKVLQQYVKARGGVVRVAQVREVARRRLEAITIDNLNPREMLRSAETYGKMAIKALGDNDFEKAAELLQTQRLFTEQAAMAEERKINIIRRLDRISRLVKKPDRELAQHYSVTVLAIARILLSRVGQYPMLTARDYMKTLEEYSPQVYARFSEVLESMSLNKPWGELTVGEADLILDMASEAITEARNARKTYAANREFSESEARESIVNYLDSTAAKPITTEAVNPATGNVGGGTTYVKDRNMMLYRTQNFIKKWVIKPLARFQALGDPFVKYIYQPVRDGYNQYVKERTDFYIKIEQIFNNPDFIKSLRRGTIEIPELTVPTRPNGRAPLVLGLTGEYAGMGQFELLGLLLHLGNRSNYEKLLKGYGWTHEQFDAAMRRLIDEGWLTKELMDTAQAIWDANKGIAKRSQEAFFELHGHNYREIENRPIETPWGTYEGGYVPALTNRDLSAYNRHESSEIAATTQDGLDIAYPFSTKSPYISTKAQEGFTEQRIQEYAQPLSLDPIELLRQNERIIRYANMMPVCKAIEHMLHSNHDEILNKLKEKDPNVWNEFLKDWLTEAAEGVRAKPMGMPERMFNTLISQTGMSIMCLNLSNTLQQVTGLVVAMTKLTPGSVAQGLLLATDRGMRDRMKELSPYMANRLADSESGLRATMQDILLSPEHKTTATGKGAAVYMKGRRWAMQHAYWMQKKAQNIIDQAVWLGSFRKSVSEGLSEAEAVKKADRDVIETQSSYDTIDLTNIKKSNSFVRAITMFGSYFYSIASLIYSEWVRAGNRPDGGMLRKFYVLTTAFILPNIIADAISKAMGRDDIFSSEDDNESESYEFWSKRWFDTVFLSQARGALGMVPILGQIINSYINEALGKNYYTDTRFNSPVFTVMSAFADSTETLLTPDEDFTYKDIRNFLQGLAAVTGFSFAAPAGRTLSYWYGDQTDDINPTGTADYVFGLITGRASPDSKQ